MRKRLLCLYGINLLQIISHAGETSNNNFNGSDQNFDKPEIRVNNNSQEEWIIKIWEQQIYEIQKQKNTYIRNSQQDLQKLVEIFKHRSESFESRLNQYLSNVSKIKNLRQKINDNQNEIKGILKTIKLPKDYLDNYLISESTCDIICDFIDELEKVINYNNTIEFMCKKVGIVI